MRRTTTLQVYYAVSRTPGEQVSHVGNADDLGYVNQHGLTRKHIFDAVQESLKRLQLDYIDVLQCPLFRKLVTLPSTNL